METVFAALIATVGSLVGVIVGAYSQRSADRRQRERERQQDEREARAERRAAADAVTGALLASLTTLRGLDEQHFEELATEMYLPGHWYEKQEAKLLALVGDIDERETRRALTNIVTALADRQTHAGKRTTYHYVESQLLLALEVAACYKRAESMDTATAAELAALQERIVRAAKAELE